MEQYIPKSVLVAEIKRKKKSAGPAHFCKETYEDGYYRGLNEALFTINSLEVKKVDIENKNKEEPISKDLEEAAKHYLYSNILYDDVYVGNPTDKDCIEMFKAGAKWQKENLWKAADGDDLPEIDREVIALLDNGKVVFAHRPPEYWDGKDIVTGKVTRNYPKTYDKGGWNIPNVKYWLDVKLPEKTEL